MNTTLKNLVHTQPAKVALSQKEINRYKAGLLLMSSFTSEDFLDLPVLPADRFGTDGLFYEIPYFHSETIWHSGMARTLLVVYKVENGGSFCPLRIEFDAQDESHFQITVIDQSGERNIKQHLIERNADGYWSEIENSDTITLSSLVK